jgi:hypothetical protein
MIVSNGITKQNLKPKEADPEDIRKVEALIVLYDAIKQRHPYKSRKTILRLIHIIAVGDLKNVLKR